MSQGTLTHAYAYARNRAKLDAHICSIQERETREREREPTYLWNLDLLHEPNAQVFQHDAVRSGKEGQNVRDEVLLIRGELFPVLHVVL